MPTAPAVAIDYASVKAQAVQTSNSLPQRLDSDISQKLEPFAGGSDSLERSAAPAKAGGGEERKPRSKLPVVENLARLLPPALSLSTLRPNIWSGSVVVPGIGEYTLTADALAGGHDLAALLGPAKLEVRGRLSMANLVKFLCELHLSTHRLAMLGVMRPLPTATPAEREGIKGLVSNYIKQSRAGVAEPHKGVEVYLVPPGELASRLLEAGKKVERDVAAGGAVARGVTKPTTILEDQMVAMVVYKKDVKVPPAVPGMYQAQSTLPMTSAAGAGAGFGAPPPYPMVPRTAPIPMVGAGQITIPMQPQQPPSAAAPPTILPAGLDLSALSALAAAFGVPPSGQSPAPQ
jgi:hypothetical protein